MSGTNRDLLLGSKSRCFACKNHRWGLGLIETSYSDARHAVLHAQNHRWGLGPIETCNFSSKVAVFNAQNHRWGLEPIETCNSVPKVTVMCAQTHRWGLGTIKTCKSGLKVAVLHEMKAGTIINLSIWCKSLWFDAQNDRLHLWLRYVLFQSKIRCFAC